MNSSYTRYFQLFSVSTLAVAMVASGNSIRVSKVANYHLAAGGELSGTPAAALAEALAKHPALAERANLLGSVTRVVETDAGTWDLYAGESIVMTLSSADRKALNIVRTRSTFAADGITLLSANIEKRSEALRFAMSDCSNQEPNGSSLADVVNPAQGQQDQDKDQDGNGQTPTPVISAS